MWEFQAEMTFTLAAAIVQFVIGAVLFIGNPRNERVAVLGALFLLNGIAQAARLVRGWAWSGDAAQAAYMVHQLSEMSTNLAILVLALVYPWRPRWLRKAPHGMFILAGLMAMIFIVRLAVGEAAFTMRDGEILTARIVLTDFGIFELAFPILLLRWSRLWEVDLSPQLRRQFALIFAALGIRAVHQNSFIPLSKVLDVGVGREFTLAGAILGVLLVGFVVAALLTSLARLATYVPDGSSRPWHLVLLLFLALGLVEGIVAVGFHIASLDGSAPTTAIVVWRTLTTGLDVFVIRPALIWFAVARFQLLGLHWHRPAVAWSFAWILGTTAVWRTLLVWMDLANVTGPWSEGVAGLIAGTIAGMGLVAARLIAQAMPLATTSSPAEIYSVHEDEVYRQGKPDPRALARLATWRRRLRLDE